MPHITTSIPMSWNVATRVYANTRQIVYNVAIRVYNTGQIVFNTAIRVRVNRIAGWNVEDLHSCLPLIQDTSVFKRIYVDYNILGPSKIYWEMSPRFSNTNEGQFQLQVATVGTSQPDSPQDAEEWINVGNPVHGNKFQINDTQQRIYGKSQNVYYRIKLTGVGPSAIYSPPVSVTGRLNKHDWLILREITRKELLRAERYVSIDGLLLKAKRFGTVCSCVNPTTGESTDSQHPTCFGTGFVGGYYDPLPCTFFDVTPKQANETRDIAQRGMVNDVIIQARFIGYPLLYAYDVFVNADSDDRFIIHSVKNLAEIRGVPVVVQAEMRLAPYKDIIYTYPVKNNGT